MLPTTPPSEIEFNGSPAPTIGVEVELQIIDPNTRKMVNAGPRLIEAVGDHMHVKPELLECVVELNTGICKDVAEVRADLGGRLQRVIAVCDELDLRLAGTGTHPFAQWGELAITDEERYLGLMERMQWLARRFMIFGLHVHVGVKNGEKAIAISNSLTAYLPFLLGLSASSPFWLGEDTGLASSRIKVFEALPTAGLPPYLRNWNQFVSYMNTLVTAGAISSIREVWWDVRPHLGFGTVEIRVCDGVNTLTEICALVALIQALVVHLDELYDAGGVLPVLKEWTLKENKWRACRWGSDARIIINERGDQMSLARKLEEIIEELEPTARRLGSEEDLGRVRYLLANPSFKRQRRLYEETRSLAAVVDACIEELRTDRPTIV